MVEEKLAYTIGHTRFKYLSEANDAFARGNFAQCKSILLSNFLDTIQDDTPVSNEIKTELDRCYLIKKNYVTELEETVKNIGYLEQKDLQEERDVLERNFILDIKSALWRIALKHNLFYDR